MNEARSYHQIKLYLLPVLPVTTVPLSYSYNASSVRPINLLFQCQHQTKTRLMLAAVVCILPDLSPDFLDRPDRTKRLHTWNK
jgi:hypothetical protein